MKYSDREASAQGIHLDRLGGAGRYVVNFTRGPLFGAGGGHHSPIAGYLVDEELVLVLDVNEKYRRWLVKSERLYDAMNTLETGAGEKRRLLLIE